VTPYAFNYDLTALAAVLVWRLCRPLPPDPMRVTVLLLAWMVPVLTMYVSALGLGLAPFVLAAAFAWSISDAVSERTSDRQPAPPVPVLA
jgi:hypothetical protein